MQYQMMFSKCSCLIELVKLQNKPSRPVLPLQLLIFTELLQRDHNLRFLALFGCNQNVVFLVICYIFVFEICQVVLRSRTTVGAVMARTAGRGEKKM